MIHSINKVINKIKTYVKKFGLFVSFGLTTYKAFDYRNRYLNAEVEQDELRQIISVLREQKIKMDKTYTGILINLGKDDNYDIDDLPFPFWYKIYDAEADDFKMVRFNRAYQDLYGKDPQEYFMRADEKVIGDLGRVYQANDRKVFETGKPQSFYENYIDEEGGMHVGKYIKWRVEKDTGIYLYGIQFEK